MAGRRVFTRVWKALASVESAVGVRDICTVVQCAIGTKPTKLVLALEANPSGTSCPEPNSANTGHSEEKERKKHYLRTLALVGRVCPANKPESALVLCIFPVLHRCMRLVN